MAPGPGTDRLHGVAVEQTGVGDVARVGIHLQMGGIHFVPPHPMAFSTVSRKGVSMVSKASTTPRRGQLHTAFQIGCEQPRVSGVLSL